MLIYKVSHRAIDDREAQKLRMLMPTLRLPCDYNMWTVARAKETWPRPHVPRASHAPIADSRTELTLALMSNLMRCLDLTLHPEPSAPIDYLQIFSR